MHSSQLLRASLVAALPLAAQAASGSGKSTRFWDCCKPSCSWPGKAAVNQPVFACQANNNRISDPGVKSGCDGGSAYNCADQSPWAINDKLAYGFAATNIQGGSEGSWCCACYALTFTSGPVAGKTMVVQSTSTGGDLGDNHFDLAIPGGGVGIFDGCSPQFGGLPGQRYGGISSQNECSSFPSALKPACNWRFDWFLNADNPTFTFQQVQCPSELTAKTGCKRSDDSNFPVFSAPSGGNPAPATMSQKPAAATTSQKPAAATTSQKPAAASTSQKPASTPSSNPVTPGGCSVPQWGQCGGQGWTGCTTCAGSSTCKVSNDWYSQCL